MSLKRYQAIRRFLHFVDNSLQKDSNDRYFKIRPLLDKMRQNFFKIKEEHKYTIDEMMVPYKGTRAGSRRQYIKNKPVKWGFKIYVRAGVSGMIFWYMVVKIPFDNILSATQNNFLAMEVRWFQSCAHLLNRNHAVLCISIISLPH